VHFIKIVVMTFFVMVSPPALIFIICFSLFQVVDDASHFLTCIVTIARATVATFKKASNVQVGAWN